jgi:hypothetical protein
MTIAEIDALISEKEHAYLAAQAELQQLHVQRNTITGNDEVRAAIAQFSPAQLETAVAEALVKMTPERRDCVVKVGGLSAKAALGKTN